MIKKKLTILAISALMVMCSGVSALAVDYGSWNSGNIYPQDVMNTEFLTPVKFLMDKKVITGEQNLLL